MRSCGSFASWRSSSRSPAWRSSRVRTFTGWRSSFAPPTCRGPRAASPISIRSRRTNATSPCRCRRGRCAGGCTSRTVAPPGTALLVSGLHPSGIDEPRLVRISRLLASNGITIVTPDIPELSRFDVSPALTDAIEHAAVWLANDSATRAESSHRPVRRQFQRRSVDCRRGTTIARRSGVAHLRLRRS